MTAKEEKHKHEQKDSKEKPKTKEEELRNKIKGMQVKEKELVETLQRLQAEFENYRKRVEKEKAEFYVYAKADFIKKILPFVDTFEIALKNKDKSDDFIKGMELMYAELVSLLRKEGLKPIVSLGKKLDPNLHDVLMTEKSGKEDGTILEEFQRGYMLNDKILRHSKVKVAKNNGDKDQPKNTSG